MINAAYFTDADNAANPPTPIFDQASKSSRSMASIQSPTTTLWVADGNGGSGIFQIGIGTIANSTVGLNVPNLAASPPSWNTMLARHLDTINVLYCDGHVKASNLGALSVRVPAGSPSAGAYKFLTIEDD